VRSALIAALGSLALAAPAAAADQTVQAVDGTAADNYNNRWEPADVTIRVGEQVTWTYTGTAAPHNVLATGANWDFRSADPAIAPPPASFRFDTPGVYTYVCEIHQTTMVGTVRVTDETGAPPPPPPPPPDSERPWPNDQKSPSVFEVVDSDPPVLSGVRVRGTRVRFRLSEAGRVTIKVKRAGRTVKTRRAAARRGLNSVAVRGLRAGRYRVEVRAWDLARNHSRVKRARLTVQR
jgi:plastocyanin